MKLLEFPSSEALMSGLAREIEKELRAALEKNGKASMAVPGGTTPAPFFEQLSVADMDWANVTVLPSDERLVPDTHPRSNASMIQAALRKNHASDLNFQPLYDAEQDKFYATELGAFLPLDISIVGMGADMHFASLFPDSPELGEALRSEDPLLRVKPASQDEARVTLTGPIFTKAKSRYLLIKGEEKRKALETAFAIQDPMVAPIAHYLEQPVSVFYCA